MAVPYTVTVPGANFNDMYAAIAHFVNNYQMVTDTMGVDESDVGLIFSSCSLVCTFLFSAISICLVPGTSMFLR